jgi:hypothetical protein
VVTMTAPASSRHVQLYALSWAGYFVLLALLPVRYGRLEAPSALLGLLSWAGGSALAAYIVHNAVSRLGSLASVTRWTVGQPLRASQLEHLIWAALLMSIVGLLCLSYDRVAIQGIDFSQGVAAAREAWRRSGEARAGVSSLFSVVGYLFGFTFYAATTLAHLHWEVLSRRTRWCVIIIAVVLVAANSLLTGGRSVLLIQLACVGATCGIRAMLGLRMLPGRGARIWLGVILATIISVGYSLYVFSARAETGNILPERYITGMLDYLGGRPTESFYRLNDLPQSIAATAELAVGLGAYLTHSYGTFETMLEARVTPGTVSFGFLRELLARLGILEPPSEEWLLSGRLPSLPAALWYDFGWAGFYLGAISVGVLIGLASRVMSVRRGGGVSLMLCVLILITGLLAPLVLATDILSVPFLMLGFIELDLCNRLLRGPTNWLYVSHPVRESYLEELPDSSVVT